MKDAAFKTISTLTTKQSQQTATKHCLKCSTQNMLGSAYTVKISYNYLMSL